MEASIYLPSEIWTEIISHMEWNDLKSTTLVDKTLRQLAWGHYFEKKYGTEDANRVQQCVPHLTWGERLYCLHHAPGPLWKWQAAPFALEMEESLADLCTHNKKLIILITKAMKSHSIWIKNHGAPKPTITSIPHPAPGEFILRPLMACAENKIILLGTHVTLANTNYRYKYGLTSIPLDPKGAPIQQEIVRHPFQDNKAFSINKIEIWNEGRHLVLSGPSPQEANKASYKFLSLEIGSTQTEQSIKKDHPKLTERQRRSLRLTHCMVPIKIPSSQKLLRVTASCPWGKNDILGLENGSLYLYSSSRKIMPICDSWKDAAFLQLPEITNSNLDTDPTLLCNTTTTIDKNICVKKIRRASEHSFFAKIGNKRMIEVTFAPPAQPANVNNN